MDLFDKLKNKQLKSPHTGIWFGVSQSAGGAVALEASGGTESETGGYKYHTFSSNGSSNQTVGTLTVSAGSADIEYLIVAGGGGSGNFYSGGGGAGGMLTGTLSDQDSDVVAHVGLKGSAGAGGSFSPRGVQFVNSGTTKTVVGSNYQNVSLSSHSSLSGLTLSPTRGYSQNAINQLTGLGFAGHQAPFNEGHQVDENNGGSGQNSWIVANSTTITAIGGGYGGYGGDNGGGSRNGGTGASGGSGGGAGKASSGGSGTSSQGNTGGNGGSGYGAGGGAGSAQAGGAGSSGEGGYGGNGTTWNGTIYAGGGFGGGTSTHSSGAGDGQANAGGGGNGGTGGGGDTTALTVGNAGKDGIVILRYAV